MGLRRRLSGKEAAANAGDPGSVPGLERSLEGGNGNPLQLSCLGNPMDRGAWWATVYGVAKSWNHLRTKQQQTAETVTEKSKVESQVYSMLPFVPF